ncbi:hypothetical protein [Paenibacillus favisporus]|uniref:hypothetical protein n=1 Tax=Paenibacillus favisporus TaxID=221028 RepID=UPI0013D15729|nr:hypothetical protein [Paenibacillus favisporus]
MSKFYKKIISVALGSALCLVSLSSAYASPSDDSSSSSPAGSSLTKSIYNFDEEFKKHEKELKVTEDDPYKEVVLDDGTVIYNSISITRGATEANAPGQDKPNTLAATASDTNTMTSSQGMKNLFGMSIYKLDYTTTWSFNYDTVLSSYSWTSVDNGLGWSFKSSNSSGPQTSNGGRTHEWTGTAQFAMVVGGIDVSNETLINQHRVNYDGSYSWRYDHS